MYFKKKIPAAQHIGIPCERKNISYLCLHIFITKHTVSFDFLFGVQCNESEAYSPEMIENWVLKIEIKKEKHSLSNSI